MDHLEKLLPIIFLLIWSLLAIQGRKKKRPRAAPPRMGRHGDRPEQAAPQQNAQRSMHQPEPPPAMGFFEALKEGMEKLNRDLQIDMEKSSAAAPQSPGQRKKMTPRLPPRKPPPQSSTSEEMPLDEIAQWGKRSAPLAQPLPAAKRHARRKKRWPLKQAVIWSEIIGPPVSLRDPPAYD